MKTLISLSVLALCANSFAASNKLACAFSDGDKVVYAQNFKLDKNKFTLTVPKYNDVPFMIAAENDELSILANVNGVLVSADGTNEVALSIHQKAGTKLTLKCAFLFVDREVRD